MSPLTGKPIYDKVFLTTDLPTTSLKQWATAVNGDLNGNGHGTSNGDHGAGVGDGEVDEHDEETVGDKKWEHAKLRAAEYIDQVGLTEEEGVDRVVEATGSEDCGLLGVAIAKQGAVCE